MHFWSTSRSPFSTFYIPFQSSGSQESNASNGAHSELKRRSYSHCKQITPKCCEISLLLREFRSLFVQCYGIPPEATRYMPQAGTLRTSSHSCNSLARKYPRKGKLPSYINSCIHCKRRWDQPNSEDFSTEDERLSFLSLGVRKPGKSKVKDHLEWQVLGERHEPLQVINFVDYSLNQGAPAGHESAETPIGHESNGAVAGDRTPNQMVPLPLPLLGTNQMAPLPGMVPLYIVHAILNTIAEEAMNFMSYVAEVSREWDEPNARDMGRMTSQPKAKGEMYILNDALGEECPTIPARGKCLVIATPTIPIGGTIQISLGNHSHLSISNMFKHFRKPQSLNKLWMDEMQNDMAKLDILQDSISRLANLNTMQEKENSPSQPYQNSMSIHEMEAKEGELQKGKKEVITLRSGKEVDLPTCKLEHKVESETEKEKREEIKGKKKGKSIEKDDYDFDIDENTEDSHQGRIDEEHMLHLFSKLCFWMIKIKRNCKEIEEKNRSKSEQNRSQTERKQGRNRGKTGVCEISQPLRNRNFAAKPVRNPIALSAKIFAAAKPILAHECHFAAQEPPFRSCESGCEPPKHEILHFAGKAPFGRVFAAAKPNFGTRVPFRSTVNLISQL
ncbi:hypothetical protein CK203_040363 [Vitis vinifera]|uniref:Uncharacterized protein n=1 Tax=Vitis vinifera TaxID=29760 RepID=A0A438FX66_VITVI|nr:hypothetical protein CK203_040363 [Vitis vinifera]